MNHFKLLACFIAIVFFSSFSSTRETLFEGQVSYKITADSDEGDFDAAVYASRFGSSAEFFFRQGNYEMRQKGDFIVPYFYLKKTNKIYFQTQEQDVLVWEHATTPNTKILKHEIKAKALKVRISMDESVDCDELKLTLSNTEGEQWQESYFYHPNRFSINGLWFNTHKLHAFNQIYAKMNAIPTRIIRIKDGIKTTFDLQKAQNYTLETHFKELEQLVAVSQLRERDKD